MCVRVHGHICCISVSGSVRVYVCVYLGGWGEWEFVPIKAVLILVGVIDSYKDLVPQLGNTHTHTHTPHHQILPLVMGDRWGSQDLLRSICWTRYAFFSFIYLFIY
jgi:hypothetical protein